MRIQEMTDRMVASGYSVQDARAKVCQDIVLKGISNSSLSKNVTIKGGVVMRSITGNVRRATQDMDIDFIRYSLSDESIDMFIHKINNLPDISIERIGSITQLNQQDYHGKSIKILIKDNEGSMIESKIDFGVHKHFEIDQDEYCFDIAYDEEGVSLLINTKEQMFVEKLRSLLKFGTFSTRYKDIYDMYYYCDKVDGDKLATCFNTYIFSDENMRENNITDIIKRISKVFGNKRYLENVDKSDKRWLDTPIDEICTRILDYLNSL